MLSSSRMLAINWPEFLEDHSLPEMGESVLTDEEIGELLDTGSVTVSIADKRWTIFLQVEPSHD